MTTYLAALLLLAQVPVDAPAIRAAAEVAVENLQPVVRAGTIDERIRGTWRSRGYGWLATLSESEFALYDHGPGGTLRVQQTSEDLLTWFGLFRFEGEAIVLCGEPVNSTAYTFDRVDAPPPGYDQPPEGGPESVFEYFWHCMADHYAFFDLWEVDWQARYEEHRPRVNAETSEAELFHVLTYALSGIGDDHLSLQARIDGQERMFSNGQPRVLWPALAERFEAQGETGDLDRYRALQVRRLRAHVAAMILDGEAQLEAGGQVLWGRLGNLGYLHIGAMGGFSKTEDKDIEVAAVHATMARILKGLADCDGIVIDIALNTGGYDDVQLAIASHFTDRPTLAFTKFPADTPGAAPQPFYVLPAERDLFLGPVSLLTSDYTVSAGEAFTLAMRSLASVTHRGTTTRGALSDMLTKRLPNGWELTLSNEVYLDRDGNHWERRGVPPEDPIVVFDPRDLEESYSAAIFEVADRMNAGE